jgi:hypothetical protein
MVFALPLPKLCPVIPTFNQDGRQAKNRKNGGMKCLWEPPWSKGRTAGHIFGREPSNEYFIKILFLLSKWFQTRRFL